MIDTSSTTGDKFKFRKARDSRGRDILGLWQRNGRFYAQMHIPGKGTRRVPLLDALERPVETVAQAVSAMAKLKIGRENGDLPGPRITPTVPDYVQSYLQYLEATEAKSPLTIRRERSSLRNLARFFGAIRLNQITGTLLNNYAAERCASGVTNRAVNLDMQALNNMLLHAQSEGWLKGTLPTARWKQLKYVSPKRGLVSSDDIEKLCAEAVRKDDTGKSVYENGQFLADFLRLLAFSGARRQAGLSARWDLVDWDNRQISFDTKFDKRVTVDFNDKLEAHLRDMWERRDDLSPWLFPSPRSGRTEDFDGYLANPQKTFNSVRIAAGLPNFRLHDLRHWFISYCVMSGIDSMTISSWVGHSDGGVLIGKTYGHLDPQHKRDAAGKLRFGRATTSPKFEVKTDISELSLEELLAAIQRKAGKAPAQAA